MTGLSNTSDVRDAMQRQLNIASQKAGWASVAEYYASGPTNLFFYAVGMMDLATSIPTWLGPPPGDGRPHARRQVGDHARSVEYADKIVRTTQSGKAGSWTSPRFSAERILEIVHDVLFADVDPVPARSTTEFRRLCEDKDVKRFAAFALVAWFGQTGS